ncbi:N-acetyltransferase family protein [Aestuariivirga sp.]|uniref:GNAT family N-acetyltransferase n=1 Tax=Aestuariivirga sp. TaxID=2650926 RepID=UPI00359327B1
MNIRAFVATDADAVWAILEPMLRKGDTYTLPSHWSRAEAMDYWLTPGHHVFVAEEGDRILGTYYLKTNQKGGGEHVCNCGFVTGVEAMGRGIARAMCAHALETAKALQYRAMQFNFVVASNTRAVALWKSFGFEIVGTLPRAFRHPQHGFVDAYVMFKTLA